MFRRKVDDQIKAGEGVAVTFVRTEEGPKKGVKN